MGDYQMQVKLFNVNQDTGEQSIIDANCNLADCFPGDDASYEGAIQLIKDNGRAWIGGGAAPLFLAVRA